jgi:hypothetical protein
MAEAVVAGGDLTHDAKESPAMNWVRAVLRGDETTALSILGEGAARQARARCRDGRKT